MDPIPFQEPTQPGKERRRCERFNLRLPARIESFSRPPDDAPVILNLVTKDISCCGAFFPSECLLEEGTRVKVDLILTPERRTDLQVKRSLIEVTGTVLRKEPGGMAIDFEERYRLVPLN